MNAYRNASMALCCCFGLYALARISGLAMLGAYAAGWIDSPAAEHAVTLLNEKLPEMNAEAFVRCHLGPTSDTASSWVLSYSQACW